MGKGVTTEGATLQQVAPLNSFWTHSGTFRENAREAQAAEQAPPCGATPQTKHIRPLYSCKALRKPLRDSAPCQRTR